MKIIRRIIPLCYFTNLSKYGLFILVTLLICSCSTIEKINPKALTFARDTIDIYQKHNSAIFVLANNSVQCSQCFKTISKVRDLLKKEINRKLELVCLMIDNNSNQSNRKHEKTIKYLLNQDTTYLDFVVNKEDNIGQIANSLGTEYYPELIVLIDGRIIHYDYKFLFETLDGQTESISKKIIEDIGIQ